VRPANFASFASKGITLTNYHAVCHPSEPNYVSALAGDYFGMNDDSFYLIDFNVSTVIDLLETKDISWGLYQEDMPYSGFEGMGWVNQRTGANDYVRKHNPAIIHNSITHYEQKLSQIKNLSMYDTANSQFHKDLKANKLPQWMFITPNMSSDGHDTSATVGGAWLDAFLTPLLEDKNFMDDTLVLITWDENETYAEKNRVLSILLGDAVPEALKGTTDNNFYNHYSEISTVEANWDLPTLGRWDVGANVYEMVANKTGDRLRDWSKCGKDFDTYYYNQSYGGTFNTAGGNKQFPAPNLKLDKSFSGREILSSIKETWKGSNNPTYYKDVIEVPDGLNPPKGYTP
jgi:acid phosphatase